MKIAVVYYSLEGNTKFIAGIIADTLRGDCIELKPVRDINPRGFMKFVTGGGLVFRKILPELAALEKQPSDYDVVVIGTPVWAFSYAPALGAFFEKNKLTGKKIAVFCCSGGGKGRTLECMKEKLAGNTIIGEIDFIEPLKKGKEENAAKAKTWAEHLKERIEPGNA
ncbi:MAG: flavodoxin [Candidatus Omnitrophica bacterium]|nr:flavodoxin [Candidatus Omnitrophota bacterium]